eukprot:11681310-Karenia_brevis.AAC.1
MVARVSSFMEHLHLEYHFDNDKHQEHLTQLGEEFNDNNEGPSVNVHLSAEPSAIHHAEPSAYLWGGHAPSLQTVDEDAAPFKNAYETDVQFIFSH